jgi:hypothetical protein
MTGLLFQLHLSSIKLSFNQTQQSEMIFDFAINQYYPTKNNIAHFDSSSHHNLTIIFTSSILLKNSLAKKLEANVVIKMTSQDLLLGFTSQSFATSHVTPATGTPTFYVLKYMKGRIWWRMTGSNRRPPACKAGALPAELIPLYKAISGGSGWTRTIDPCVINTVL